jgi:uncharacterized protein (TIGR04255 family)
MGKKMAKAPVYYVLIQVRFNPLLTLEHYVPAIQDSLRKAGFADFSKSTVATVNLNIGPQPMADQMPVSQVNRFLFLDEGKTTGFLMDHSSMSLQTTEYDTFEPFRDAFLLGLKTLDGAVGGLDFSERLGIRFLDAVCPREGEALSDYLTQSLLGMTRTLHGRTLSHAISETWSTMDHSGLMCRAVIQNRPERGVSFPPDLQPVFLQIPEKFQGITGLYGILDTDCWHQNREKFDIDAIGVRLERMHSDVRRSFNDMVTPHALKTWE